MDDLKGIAVAVGLGYLALGFVWLLGIFLLRGMGAIEWEGLFNCHSSAIWVLGTMGGLLIVLSLWAQFQGGSRYPRGM